MKKVLVIKDVENNKYYTGRYWDGSEASWTRDIDDAAEWNSENKFLEEISRATEENEKDEYSFNILDSLNGKTIILETIFKFNK